MVGKGKTVEGNGGKYVEWGELRVDDDPGRTMDERRDDKGTTREEGGGGAKAEAEGGGERDEVTVEGPFSSGSSSLVFLR